MGQNSALFYHPEAYSISGPKLMGRNAAGESFLRGYLEHSRMDHFTIQVSDIAHCESFKEILTRTREASNVTVVTPSSLPALSGVDAVFHPGPGIGTHAKQRALFDHGAWSLCGITHTTSSGGAMDAITEMLTQPVQDWDGLICTSNAVKANVLNLLQLQLAELESRLGVTRFVLPQMPVIPLGIHVKEFEFDDNEIKEAREHLQIHEAEVVILYMGRLSFHAKAHPLAMYQALELASNKLGKAVHLIECGWFANEYIQRAFISAAKQIAPSVKVTYLDGRDPANKRRAWAVADVFCSLSDNIQETFGITPIEAMAVGLPSVVSDWNGYKDTVRDGIDGFRIPTSGPPGGYGGDLATSHALGIDNYDRYCGYTSSLIAVDVNAAAGALETLIASKQRRLEFGAQARQRAKDIFDWGKIIPQYQEFWAELRARRVATPAASWPARPDPFKVFAHYASEVLLPGHMLRLSSSTSDPVKRFHDLMKLEMVKYASLVIPTEQEAFRIFQACSVGVISAQKICEQFSESRKPYVYRGLLWMLKMNLIERVR